jgi:hypothetical protein
MAKNPVYGVRFNQEVLKKIRENQPDIKPQSALKVYEKAYVELEDFKKSVVSEVDEFKETVVLGLENVLKKLKS